MIINQEIGLNYCKNRWRGSFFIDELTDLGGEAVYNLKLPGQIAGASV